MTEARSTEPQRGLTFDDVWAALMENREQMKETDLRLKEAERIVKENGKQIGGLHRSFGELAEHLVAPGMVEKFNKMGFNIRSATTRGCEIFDKRRKVIAEIDVILEDDEYIIAVEVKSRPAVQDIERHIKRIEIFRKYKNRINDTRKILGAVAGAVFTPDVKEETIKAGMYVAEQSGDTMKISVPKGFVPAEW